MANPDERSMWLRTLKSALRVSMLGWDLGVPIVAGAVLGHMLGDRYQTGPILTVALLVLGLTVGVYNVWRQLRLEVKCVARVKYEAHTQDEAQ